jgi:hypothetical protein
MGGLFAHWQPRYAEKGIATFPVRDKRPAVRGYLKLGMRASQQLATKFPTDDAFGFACRRNGITVLDVDAPDERLLAEAMAEFGESPLVIQSGSGNYQAWYRNSGEGRRIRPDPARPIDILGDGFVVAPPSKSSSGAYSIICGTLDELASLPPMRQPSPPAGGNKIARPRVAQGSRNDTLWRHCMQKARRCSIIEELMEEAVRHNAAQFYEPLPDDEVLRVVASAWAKKTNGTNWFGGGRVIFDAAEVDDLLSLDQDAFVLLAILRRRNWGRDFVIANAMAAIMPEGGWRRQRLTAARQRLVDTGIVEQIRPPSPANGPALFRFKGVQ